jgi:hypothetical protein
VADSYGKRFGGGWSAFWRATQISWELRGGWTCVEDVDLRLAGAGRGRRRRAAHGRPLVQGGTTEAARVIEMESVNHQGSMVSGCSPSFRARSIGIGAPTMPWPMRLSCSYRHPQPASPAGGTQHRWRGASSQARIVLTPGTTGARFSLRVHQETGIIARGWATCFARQAYQEAAWCPGRNLWT